MKKFFRTLALAGMVLTGGAFTTTLDDHKANDEDLVVSELFVIMDIGNDEQGRLEVHGEKVTGWGEGFFYYMEQLEELGAKDLDIGDQIVIGWRYEDFNNSNWDEIEYIKQFD